jgi:hypothetical protein
MTLSIKTLSITTLSIKTLSITTLSIIIFGIIIKKRDTLHDDMMTLSKMAERCCAKFHYTERYLCSVSHLSPSC